MRLFGFVEVNVNGTWGSVCGQGSWGYLATTAFVVCRQLGFPTAGAQGWSNGIITTDPGYPPVTVYNGPGTSGTVPFLLSYVQCTGVEGQIFDCPHFVNGVWNFGSVAIGSQTTTVCMGSDLGKNICYNRNNDFIISFHIRENDL